jgi:hypothetical protein
MVRLQLLLAFTSAMVLEYKSNWTCDRILLSDSKLHQRGPGSSVYSPKVTLQLTVSQSINLGVETHLKVMTLMTRYVLLSDSYGHVSVGRHP